MAARIFIYKNYNYVVWDCEHWQESWRFSDTDT